MPRSKIVLLVEDQPVIAAEVKGILEGFGCTVIGPFGTLKAARPACGGLPPDLAMIDLSLPDGDGLDLVRELRGRGVECAVCSGYDRHSVIGKEPLVVHWIDKLSIVEDIERVLTDSGLLDPE